MFRFRQFHARVWGHRGQTFAEYALILAAVSAGVLLTLTWTGVSTAIQSALDVVTGAF